jgi:DNA repair protein RadA/Sms
VARPASRYVCQTCAAAFPRWEGQCRNCGSWNTLVETVLARAPRGTSRRSGPTATAGEPVALGNVAPGSAPRLTIGIAELDRVLGGGVVVGSLVLLAGEPGVGKSTLSLGAAAALAAQTDRPVLYVSGEESPGQLQLRAGRLGLLAGPLAERLHVFSAVDVEGVIEAARRLTPAMLIVDSIQSLTVDELEGPAGSVGQVREAAQRLLLLAKGEDLPIVLVGHVTKDGSVAGPKTLEHLVDVVLTLEGEPGAVVRLLRATKNRFGSTEEVGLFEMSPGGLLPLSDPAELFAPAGATRPAGSAVALLLEGSRPLLVEVQALVGGGGYGPPRRAASGIELDRLALLTAVLAKRAGVGIGSHDVYVSLAGGLRSREPALDLPLALALASSVRDRPIRAGMVAGAEVALSGELRPVPQVERRLREAARLGYRHALVAGSGERDVDGLHVIGATSLRAALDAALDRSAGPKPVDTRAAGTADDPVDDTAHVETRPTRLAALPIEPGRRP